MPHRINFGDFYNATKLPRDTMRSLMKTLANKTVEEQLMIFKIKTEIYTTVKTNNRQQIDQLKLFKQQYPQGYDYTMLLLAIQLHDADTTKSEYISEVREARQSPLSFKTSPLKKVILALIPLIDNLRAKGATWQEITKMINTKKRKILSNRKVSVEYLKKTYYSIKKERQN